MVIFVFREDNRFKCQGKLRNSKMKSSMSVLDLHPEYKPFVGKCYNDSKKTSIKILFIGESPYLHKEYNIGYSDWYKKDTDYFKRKYKIEGKYLCLRKCIK